MLPLLRHASSLIPPVIPLVDTTEAILANKLYQAASHGFAYRTAANFQPFTHAVLGEQVREDWVSTEATGIVISALLGDLN